MKRRTKVGGTDNPPQSPLEKEGKFAYAGDKPRCYIRRKQVPMLHTPVTDPDATFKHIPELTMQTCGYTYGENHGDKSENLRPTGTHKF